LVSNVRQGRQKDAEALAKYGPSIWVDIEGLSCLRGRNCKESPTPGTEIEGVVTVRWGRGQGAKPVHFLESWQPAI
jgi:hypothetical protein